MALISQTVIQESQKQLTDLMRKKKTGQKLKELVCVEPKSGPKFVHQKRDLMVLSYGNQKCVKNCTL